MVNYCANMQFNLEARTGIWGGRLRIETQPPYTACVGLELTILLPQTPEC